MTAGPLVVRKGWAVRVVIAMFAIGWTLVWPSAARAEIVEEIIAWVNGDVITKSEFDKAEQELTADLYRRYSGAELDAQLVAARGALLQNLIDRKVLVDRAARLYDIKAIGDELIDDFKSNQKIENDEQLHALLDREGMTLAELRDLLIENTFPDQVIRVEVRNRISVTDAEVRAYYDEHPGEFEEPLRFVVQEIVLLADDANRQRRRAEAEQVRALAAADGADFAALAAQYSESGTRDSGGRLAEAGIGDLSPELERQARQLAVGDVSQVLEMPYGFHIVRLESRRDARVRPFEEVGAEVRERIENDEFYTELQTFLKRARDEAEWSVNVKYQDLLVPNRK